MLAHLCPNLSTLEVAGCSQFTDTGFQALARSCRLLEKMDLEECALITDTTLIHLAMGCPRLEKLVSVALQRINLIEISDRSKAQNL